MKRYLLFAGQSFYPNGGCYDLIGDFETEDEILAAWEEYLVTARNTYKGIEDSWGHYTDLASRGITVLQEGTYGGQSKYSPQVLNLVD